ncbi:hypothetical protein V5799_014709 [Amblyomma americanum]|uniref:Uncharacterized protein n=1 Tax=Amblyomma americanum TaxID=6943 RepID=A0AAQ4E286_AMBAM
MVFTCPVENANQPADWTQQPCLQIHLEGNLFFGWQPRSFITSDTTISAGHTEYKLLPVNAPLGHDAVLAMEHLPFTLFQAALLLGSSLPCLASDMVFTCPVENANQPADWTQQPCLQIHLEGNLFFGWQPRSFITSDTTISAGHTEYKLLPVNAPLGHDAVLAMEHLPFTLFQAALLLGSSLPCLASDMVFTCPVENANQPADWTQQPCLQIHLEGNLFFGWQPRSFITSDTTISAGHTEYKLLPVNAPLGHDAVLAMEHLPFTLFQVSYLDHCTCLRSKNRCLFLVSCPREWLFALEACEETVQHCLSSLFLILSGDVETNPGPDSNDILATVLKTVQRIESGQDGIRSDLRELKQWQASVDIELKQLSSRLRSVEVDVSDLKNNPAASSADSPGAVSSVISDQLRIIESRCNDAENRMRRCNLLFFGLSDDISETWPSAETKVIDLCKNELDITVDSSQIERAHRIGKYDPEKCRPVMVKFTLFKDKQQIIGNGIKLKGTNYAVREDFSFQTRLARKKLIEFAKPQKVPYKLNVDKLRINDSVYVYDAATDTVKLSSA